VASFEMMFSSARSMLWVGLSHQAGLRSSTVLRSGSRLTSRKGPVPMALRVAKFSSRVVRSTGFVALFFSDQAFDMMPQVTSSCSMIGFGAVVSISTVLSSTLRTSFTVASTAARFEPWARTRCALKTTSSAVKGVPSVNFTPLRRWKRQTVGEDCSQLSASAGSMPISLFRRTSGS